MFGRGHCFSIGTLIGMNQADGIWEFIVVVVSTGVARRTMEFGMYNWNLFQHISQYIERTNKKLHIFLFVLSCFYSHSMVAGGLLLISYTTRLIPRTLLMISLEMFARNS